MQKKIYAAVPAWQGEYEPIQEPVLPKRLVDFLKARASVDGKKEDEKNWIVIYWYESRSLTVE